SGATNDVTLPSVGSLVESFWFSPDGRFVAASYGNGSNIIWNLSTRGPVLKWGRRWRFESFSSDSAHVIVFERPATLCCLALADCQELWHCQTAAFWVTTLACAPGGRYFALADFTNTAVQVRAVDTGELARELPGRGPVGGLNWSLDGQRLVVGRVNGWLE